MADCAAQLSAKPVYAATAAVRSNEKYGHAFHRRRERGPCETKRAGHKLAIGDKDVEGGGWEQQIERPGCQHALWSASCRSDHDKGVP
jgi:hypothetical protein